MGHRVFLRRGPGLEYIDELDKNKDARLYEIQATIGAVSSAGYKAEI